MASEIDLVERFISAAQKDLERLSTDVGAIKEYIAFMKGADFKTSIKELADTVTKLEVIKNRLIGGILILGLIWTPFCAIVTGIIVWWVTKSN
jgi:hypothetical protein